MGTINKLISILLLFTLGNCNSSSPDYSFYILHDPEIKVDVVGSIKNGKEYGFWSISRRDGNLMAQGFYDHGLKIGKWNYPIFSDSLYWKILDIGELKINLPYDMVIFEDNFFHTYTDNYNFMIEKDTSMTPYDYHLFNKNQVLNYNNPTNFVEYQLIQQTDTSYFSSFEVKNDSLNYFVFCLMKSIKETTYVFGLKAPNDNLALEQKIFFDILEGCYIRKERVISPLLNTQVKQIHSI
ncbi:MAG TPA: hypothetical protein VK172_08085 [Lentimicrobium sp.]|nr:hypothetical protein [Lentimicrobium sp.]